MTLIKKRYRKNRQDEADDYNCSIFWSREKLLRYYAIVYKAMSNKLTRLRVHYSSAANTKSFRDLN